MMRMVRLVKPYFVELFGELDLSIGCGAASGGERMLDSTCLWHRVANARGSGHVAIYLTLLCVGPFCSKRFRYPKIPTLQKRGARLNAVDKR